MDLPTMMVSGHFVPPPLVYRVRFFYNVLVPKLCFDQFLLGVFVRDIKIEFPISKFNSMLALLPHINRMRMRQK